MKTAAFLILLALAVMVASCGTGKPTTTVENTTNGTWEAQLVGGTGPASQLDFIIQFSVTNVNGTTEPLTFPSGPFSFINSQAQPGSCFPSGETVTGTATITVLSTNQVEGTMAINVVGAAGTSTLALTGTNVYGTANGTPGTIGTLTNGVVTGTWALTGACLPSGTSSETGAFTMCQGAATCTIP
jgi:hypothetical protein